MAVIALVFAWCTVAQDAIAQGTSFDRIFTYEAETQLSHGLGYYDEDGWAANVASQSAGHLVFGPYATNWGDGGGKAVFRLLIDNNNRADSVTIVTIDIYDADQDRIVASRDIRRNDFDHPFTYQDFELWFELSGQVGHRLETRVRWLDRAFVRIDKITVGIDDIQPGIPEIKNFSDSSDEHVRQLVERAISGLGFLNIPVRFDAPNRRDFVFVGRYYMAWIDQTGFYGKMNGLWQLNGAPGDRLAFLHQTEDTNRPINFLGVAEEGDGKWMGGYRGAEHYELPLVTPEFDEDRNGNGQCDADETCVGSACGAPQICNWYSLNEAAPITRNMKHWQACNPNRESWAKLHAPIAYEHVGRSLRIVYEGRITKESDKGLDGIQEGDFCHRDFLFPDGVRRPVYFQVGYVLHGDKNYFDRSYRIRNPAGNPFFGGTPGQGAMEWFGIIGGLVVSSWPTTQAWKGELMRTIRPEFRDISPDNQWTSLPQGKWTDFTPMRSEEVFSWLETPVSWSRYSRFSRGSSLRMDVLGPDNGDVGFCYCSGHGGIEIGGSVLHSGGSLPIDGNSTSSETIRRFTFPESHNSPFVYEAEGPELNHGTGAGDWDSWWASTADHWRTYLIYGPYATQWGTGSKTALFRMMTDNTTAGGNVATLDAYDASTGTILASRIISRSAFPTANQYKEFALDFNLSGRSEHAIETRVLWHDTAWMKVDNVKIYDGYAYSGAATYEPETGDLMKNTGWKDGDGWAAAVGFAPVGHLVYGPYARDWGAAVKVAEFYLMIDSTSGTDRVAIIDVVDVDSGQILTSKAIYRNEFSAPMAYQRFDLTFDLKYLAGHAIDTRVYWEGRAWMKIDKVRVRDRDR